MTTHTPSIADLDHTHLWHPFTAMKEWRQEAPLVIERGEKFFLFDADGNRFIDGVSSLWCNVHGHNVPEIDAAVIDQLGKIAHTTLLGLSSPPAIRLAAQLCGCAPKGLNKAFFSDSGATAVEVAFKMAAGFWFHSGRPEKNRFIGLAGAYHGDTAGAMSVGYSDLFHRPFKPMTFVVDWFPSPDALRPAEGRAGPRPHEAPRGMWPSEWEPLTQAAGDHSLCELRRMLEQDAGSVAAVCIEPAMQGAAGMVCQPKGFLKRVEQLCRAHDVLLIADEVATGFGRTGSLFACDGEGVQPDLLALAKGISGGYLPLAATLATDAVEQAFCSAGEERRTFFHGHTYTGNPLACAAGLASLALFQKPPAGSAFPDVLSHARASAQIIARELDALRGNPHVLDVRQRGLMVGIELGRRHADGSAAPFDFSKRTAHAICRQLRDEGVIVRPLGDVLVLMPAPAMPHDLVAELAGKMVKAVEGWRF